MRAVPGPCAAGTTCQKPALRSGIAEERRRVKQPLWLRGLSCARLGRRCIHREKVRASPSPLREGKAEMAPDPPAGRGEGLHSSGTG